MNNDMVCDQLLECVFQPRYMTFDLCVRLEPVARLFMKKAGRFYEQLQQVDVQYFTDKADNVKWACKLFQRCPNVETIKNIPFRKKNLNQDLIHAHRGGEGGDYPPLRGTKTGH